MRNKKRPTAIANLYNGIISDSSIKRYALGGNGILTMIECYYGVPKQEVVYFDDDLVKSALEECRINELKITIENFQSELKFLKG
jgi:hypothetical protein